MFLSIREKQSYQEIYSLTINNQNYVPPFPDMGDEIVLHPETPTSSKRFYVVDRLFHYDELGLTGITVEVEADKES